MDPANSIRSVTEQMVMVYSKVIFMRLAAGTAYVVYLAHQFEANISEKDLT